MKKCFLLLPCVLVLLVFLACDNERVCHWEFKQSYNNVKEIKIIETIDDFGGIEASDYSVLAELDIGLAENLYSDIEAVEMKKYGTNLGSPVGICILVLFNNGEYDIISKQEPKHFKHENGEIKAYNSWLTCDEAQFENLINKYLNLQ